MNGAHQHLLVNHVSLFAMAFGAAILAFSMYRKSADLRLVATLLFVIAGVFALIATETGESAEKILKAIDPKFRDAIHPHEEAAEWALRSGYLVCFLALVNEWAQRARKTWARWVQWALLVFAVHGTTVFSATAWQGGKIRHTETQDLIAPAPQ
jgi:uncharacterized membrane protein